MRKVLFLPSLKKKFDVDKFYIRATHLRETFIFVLTENLEVPKKYFDLKQATEKIAHL